MVAGEREIRRIHRYINIFGGPGFLVEGTFQMPYQSVILEGQMAHLSKRGLASHWGVRSSER